MSATFTLSIVDLKNIVNVINPFFKKKRYYLAERVVTCSCNGNDFQLSLSVSQLSHRLENVAVGDSMQFTVDWTELVAALKGLFKLTKDHITFTMDDGKLTVGISELDVAMPLVLYPDLEVKVPTGIPSHIYGAAIYSPQGLEERLSFVLPYVHKDADREELHFVHWMAGGGYIEALNGHAWAGASHIPHEDPTELLLPEMLLSPEATAAVIAYCKSANKAKVLDVDVAVIHHKEAEGMLPQLRLASAYGSLSVPCKVKTTEYTDARNYPDIESILVKAKEAHHPAGFIVTVAELSRVTELLAVRKEKNMAFICYADKIIVQGIESLAYHTMSATPSPAPEEPFCLMFPVDGIQSICKAFTHKKLRSTVAAVFTRTDGPSVWQEQGSDNRIMLMPMKSDDFALDDGVFRKLADNAG